MTREPDAAAGDTAPAGIGRGRLSLLIAAIAFSFGAFQLATAGFGLLPDLQQRAAHLLFATTICLLWGFRRGGAGMFGGSSTSSSFSAPRPQTSICWSTPTTS